MPTKKLSIRIQALFLGLVYLSFPYIVFAFKLFPNGDSYNGYVSIYYYLISSLLDGGIPLWDPMAACGSPFYLLFMTAGVFEPLFAVSVLAGKLLGLNVLQIYFLWAFLRTLPLLLGMYWLLKQLSRNDWLALFCSAFFYYTISFCLFRDGIPYVLYWPLMLACAVHFIRSLTKSKPSNRSFLGMVTCLGVSLLLHNPSYTVVFLGALFVSLMVVSMRQCRKLSTLFVTKVSRRALAAGLVILAMLVSPAVVLWHHYRDGDYFAYVRVHQAQRNVGRSISNFDKEDLDYIEVSLDASPMRQGRELSTVFFPFLYGMKWVADGTLYFGLLGFLGILFGIIRRNSRAFFVYLAAGLLIIFYMTWSANGLILILRPVLPILKILNQRQLLYSAFLLFASVAGCLGLQALIEAKERRELFNKLSWGKALGLAAVLVGGFLIFALLTTTSTLEAKTIFNMKIARMSLVFVLLWALIVYAAKKSLKTRAWNKGLLIIIAAVFVADLGFYLSFLSRVYLPDRNEDFTAKSRLIRQKLSLEYRPFRSPMLPAVYGGTHTNSLVHQVNIRTALPAYWHSDITFSTKRYYDLINSLDASRVKYLLSIDSPVIKLYPKTLELPAGEDAIPRLSLIGFQEFADTVILEQPAALNNSVKDNIERRSFASQPLIRRTLPPLGPFPDGFEGTYYSALYDYSLRFPWGSFAEVSQGIYHKRLYRLQFDKNTGLVFKDNEKLLERVYLPEFPFATDVDGSLYFVDRDREAMLRIVSGEGILVETDRSDVVLPNVLYGRHSRRDDSGRVQVMRFSANFVKLHIEADQPSALVYTDLFDSHWKARLDGKPVPIYLANHAFKAVKVPAGEHILVFEYGVLYLKESLLLYYGLLGGLLCYYAAGFRRVSTRLKKI